MKAIRLYEPGNIKVEHVDTPSISSQEVLIQVKAVGICGSDIPRAILKGAYYEGLILGHEFAGIIVECGQDTEGWTIGDRVTIAPLVPCMECEYCKQGRYGLCEDYDYYGSRTDGAMAKFIKVHKNNLLRIPETISYEAAAMVDPAANAVHGLWRGNLRPGDTAVIIGLGAIGLFAVQFAREMGAKEIVAIDIFEEKLHIAKQLGADRVINSQDVDPIEVLENTKVNVVLDTSGSPIAQNQAVSILGKMGRAVFLGISNQELTLSAKAVEKLLRYEIEVYGSWNSFSKPFPGKEWEFTIECMAKGKIITDPIVSHRFQIEEVPDVFKKIKNREIVFNKILIFPEE